MSSRTELIARTRSLIKHVEERSTGQTDRIHRIPTSDYRDQSRWQREIDEVFMRCPQALALSAELPNVDDYKSIDVVGLPVVIRRGSDGVVRSFYNVCTHRAATIADVGLGTARQMVCPYHGWSYDSKGCLSGVPAQKTFGDLDRSQLGLTELPTEERHGIIWVVLTPDTEMDLDEWVGAAAPVLDELNLASLHHFSTRQFDGPNWKVALDGYLEVYHFPVLHRHSFNKSVHGNVTEVEALDRHQRIFFARRGIVELKDQSEEQWEVDQWLGQTLHIFPNVEIAFGFLPSNEGQKPTFGRHCLVHMLYPGATVGASITHQINLTSVPVSSDEDKELLDHISEESYRVVTDEDYWVGNRIQHSLAKAAPAFLMFGRNEQALTHYHLHLDKLLKER